MTPAKRAGNPGTALGMGSAFRCSRRLWVRFVDRSGSVTWWKLRCFHNSAGLWLAHSGLGTLEVGGEAGSDRPGRLACPRSCAAAPVLGAHWFALCPSWSVGRHFLVSFTRLCALLSEGPRGPSAGRSRTAPRAVCALRPARTLASRGSVRALGGVTLCPCACACGSVHVWDCTRVCSSGGA